MWNVEGPFEAGSLADSAVVSEVAQSLNNLCLSLVEEGSEVQTAPATVADSVVAEGVEGMAAAAVVDEVGVSVVVEVVSVAVVTTTGVVAVAVDMVVADSGVHCVPYFPNRD